MIDWEDIQKEDSEEELKKLKIFLFQENMRIAQEKKRLEEEKARLIKLQDDFMKDRVTLRDELDELNRRTLNERKRLKEENLFFDKKMQILTEGFRSLEEDRRKFEKEKKAYLERINNQSSSGNADAAAKALAEGNLAYDPDARCDHHEHHDGDCGHKHCAEHHCAGN